MWGSVARRGGSSAGSLPRKPGNRGQAVPIPLIRLGKAVKPCLHGPPLLPQVVWTDNDAGEWAARRSRGWRRLPPLAIPKGLDIEIMRNANTEPRIGARLRICADGKM